MAKAKKRQKLMTILTNINSSDMIKDANKQLKNVQFCLNKVVTGSETLCQ